ncbi:hypothetical protein [Streptomyces sp. NPDC047525]|uniref:hypothetical protein n=1 Tax=Streptomyces sp. NPDC047525 TaxID=3155264 RepID=UPI0033BFE620
MNDVSGLVEAVRVGGTDGEDAALILGLLIERERVYRPLADDGGITAVLSKEYANWRLSQVEVTLVVEELIAHVSQAGEVTSPSVIWALSKSYDPRIVPPFVDLLLELIDRVDKEDLCYQILLSVINVGIGSCFRERVRDAVRLAAARSPGLVGRTARDYVASIGLFDDGDQ